MQVFEFQLYSDWENHEEGKFFLSVEKAIAYAKSTAIKEFIAGEASANEDYIVTADDIIIKQEMLSDTPNELPPFTYHVKHDFEEYDYEKGYIIIHNIIE